MPVNQNIKENANILLFKKKFLGKALMERNVRKMIGK